MREKFLCFIHSSYLCSRRQKMQSIMKKKIYIIIAFCTFLTAEARKNIGGFYFDIKNP